MFGKYFMHSPHEIFVVVVTTIQRNKYLRSCILPIVFQPKTELIQCQWTRQHKICWTKNRNNTTIYMNTWNRYTFTDGFILVRSWFVLIILANRTALSDNERLELRQTLILKVKFNVILNPFPISNSIRYDLKWHIVETHERNIEPTIAWLVNEASNGE